MPQSTCIFFVVFVVGLLLVVVVVVALDEQVLAGLQDKKWHYNY